MSEVTFFKNPPSRPHYDEPEGNLAFIVDRMIMDGTVIWTREEEMYSAYGALFVPEGFFVYPQYLLDLVDRENGYADCTLEELEKQLLKESLLVTGPDGEALVEVPQPEGGERYLAYRLHLPNIIQTAEEYYDGWERYMVERRLDRDEA